MTQLSAVIWLVLGIAVIEAAIIATALFGRILVEQGKLAAPDNVAHIIVTLSFDALPPFLGAMLMAVIVAIVVSTADSYLLAPATSIVRDVYQRFVAPEAPAKRVVLLGRVVVVVLGLIALWMAFQSELFFDSGSAVLNAEGRSELDKLAVALLDLERQIPSEIQWVLRVDGHTDVRPILTTQYRSNWDLSAARAISVVQYLIAKGVSPQRLVAAGFGEFQPLDPALTEEAFRRNRRLELKLTER